MISNKTRYGLQALFYLARNYNRGPVLISDLAKKEAIPQKFLEAILLDLKNHGLLKSKKGKGGGYALAKSSEQITMGQVMRLLEGPLAPVPCVSQTAYRKCDECRDEESCCLRIMMKDVRDAMANVLDKTTLADILKRAKTFPENEPMTYFI